MMRSMKVKKHFNRLYDLTPSDYYESYSLWNKISGRIQLFFNDFKKEPVKAIEKHLKIRYAFSVFSFIWNKYKLSLLISFVVVTSLILIIKFRKYFLPNHK
jgi:hypothetical protein